jgi:hypothetical protein
MYGGGNLTVGAHSAASTLNVTGFKGTCAAQGASSAGIGLTFLNAVTGVTTECTATNAMTVEV